MTENKQFIFVIDNGEPTFYDLSKKEIMNMNETEEMLNTINNENEELKEEVKTLKYRLSSYETE